MNTLGQYLGYLIIVAVAGDVEQAMAMLDEVIGQHDELANEAIEAATMAIFEAAGNAALADRLADALHRADPSLRGRVLALLPSQEDQLSVPYNTREEAEAAMARLPRLLGVEYYVALGWEYDHEAEAQGFRNSWYIRVRYPRAEYGREYLAAVLGAKVA